MDFEYKKYSLENLEKWMSDALLSSEATPQEIYDIIRKVVEEEYHYFKHHTGRCYELLALLNGNGKGHLSCDKDDQSEECKKSWTSFWEEYHYPEEVKDDGMRPWGHSDLEYMIANPTLTEDRISNFPGEQYTEEELNAMCDKAVSDQEKEKCREYNLREAEYYDKRSQVDADYEKVKSWVLPTEVDGLTGDVTVNLPDDLLKAANLKEGDQIQWVDNGDGSYKMVKVTEPLKMDEC
jgi:hypothetical protein